MALTDDESPLGDPAESLALIQREQANLVRDITPDPRLMLWPWGFAWLIGFGALFLRYGPNGHVYVDMPSFVPLNLLLLLIFAAGVVTGVGARRHARSLSGPTSRQGRYYGLTWAISFACMVTLFSLFVDDMPEDRSSLLWAGGMVALAGALHMAGGALWNNRDLFNLGAWTSVINMIGIVLGPGWHSLIVAIAGGGAMLLTGLVGWLRLR
jgi:hypothetical protein